MNDWHVRTQRSNQFALALSQAGHLCVYVNPHLGLEYRLPYLFSSSPQARRLAKNVIELHVHLPREHGLNLRLLLPSEVGRITQAVDDLLRREGVTQAVSVTSFPVWLDVVERLRSEHGFPILYDCHDLLCGFGKVSPDIMDLEDQLLEICDWVAFSSAYLLDWAIERMPSLSGKVALIRNAANPVDFGSSRTPKTTQKRTVGYLGALDHWFDTNAVMTAAQAHPSVNFVLIGSVEDPAIFQLKACPNVHFTGEVPHTELKNHLATWSAAMIPFLRTPLTLATNPIKVYEYFSTGLPVVGTRLPELELFGELIYLAASAREFSEQIAKAIAEPGDVLRKRRKEVASHESWAHRADQLLAVVSPQPVMAQVSPPEAV